MSDRVCIHVYTVESIHFDVLYDILCRFRCYFLNIRTYHVFPTKTHLKRHNNQPPIRGHPLRIQLDLRSDGVCVATMKSGEVNLITGTLGRQKESKPKMDPK